VRDARRWGRIPGRCPYPAHVKTCVGGARRRMALRVPLRSPLTGDRQAHPGSRACCLSVNGADRGARANDNERQRSVRIGKGSSSFVRGGSASQRVTPRTRCIDFWINRSGCTRKQHHLLTPRGANRRWVLSEAFSDVRRMPVRVASASGEFVTGPCAERKRSDVRHERVELPRRRPG